MCLEFWGHIKQDFDFHKTKLSTAYLIRKGADPKDQ